MPPINNGEDGKNPGNGYTNVHKRFLPLPPFSEACCGLVKPQDIGCGLVERSPDPIMGKMGRIQGKYWRRGRGTYIQ